MLYPEAGLPVQPDWAAGVFMSSDKDTSNKKIVRRDKNKAIFFFTFIREWSIEDREVPANNLSYWNIFFILIEKNIRIVYLELQKVNLLISAL